MYKCIILFSGKHFISNLPFSVSVVCCDLGTTLRLLHGTNVIDVSTRLRRSSPTFVRVLSSDADLGFTPVSVNTDGSRGALSRACPVGTSCTLTFFLLLALFGGDFWASLCCMSGRMVLLSGTGVLLVRGDCNRDCSLGVCGL